MHVAHQKAILTAHHLSRENPWMVCAELHQAQYNNVVCTVTHTEIPVSVALQFS